MYSTVHILYQRTVSDIKPYRKRLLYIYTQVLTPQSNQSAGPVRFLMFCSISIFQLASLVAGRRFQYTAGAD